MSGIPEGRVGQIAHAGRQGTKTIYEGVSFCCLRVDAYLVMFQVSYLHCRVQDSVFALEGTLCFLSCCCCQTAECSLCLYSQSTMSLAGYCMSQFLTAEFAGNYRNSAIAASFVDNLVSASDPIITQVEAKQLTP